MSSFTGKRCRYHQNGSQPTQDISQPLSHATILNEPALHTKEANWYVLIKTDGYSFPRSIDVDFLILEELES